MATKHYNYQSYDLYCKMDPIGYTELANNESAKFYCLLLSHQTFTVYHIKSDWRDRIIIFVYFTI